MTWGYIRLDLDPHVLDDIETEKSDRPRKMFNKWLQRSDCSWQKVLDAVKSTCGAKPMEDIRTALEEALLPSPELQRKRPRSSSQSSEEPILQPHKRHHDYLHLKMDLLAQDISDLRCESDPNAIIRLLYSNALGVITKLLQPHLADVKKLASRYCRLGLHHGKVTERMITSAKSIEGLLNQMSVTEKWDDTRFLRKAVTTIPLAPKREVAEVILSYYDLHLIHYERATLLKKKPKRKGRKPTEKNMKLVPFEITIQKPFSDVTIEDCHRLHVRVLSTAYGIPEESIIYYGAEERHSTTITYLIPRQYISEIMQCNTQLETVWVLLELDVMEVAIPDVFLFKPSVDHCLKLLKNSRTFKVDLLGMTEVLPYQMYALVDTNVDPLMRFDRPNLGTTAGTPSPMATISPSVKEEPPSATHESEAPPAVPEHGACSDPSYNSMTELPGDRTQLRETDLQQIANNLPHCKWKPLGRVLGLHNSDLDNIVAKHPTDPVEQRYQMLQLWSSQDVDASQEKLDNALRSEEVRCPHLASMRKVREVSESKEYLTVYSESAASAGSTPVESELASTAQPSPPRSLEPPEGVNCEETLKLNPMHFLEYRLLAGWFKEDQHFPNLIRISLLVTLYILLVIQLFATPKVAHLLHDRSSYPSTCKHSGLIFIVTVSLWYSIRFVFPLLLILRFHYVLKRLGVVVHRGQKFLEELQLDRNFNVLRKIALILFNIHVDEAKPMAEQKKKILQRAWEDFADDLHAMCLSSLFEGVLLTLAVIGLGAVHYPAVVYPNMIGLSLLGLFDIISCLVLSIFCSLMLAFCFLEMKLKYTITAVLEAESLVTGDFGSDAAQQTVTLTESLKGEGEKIMNCLTLTWCTVDIFMHLGTGLFSILLIISATSGLPLSCGVQVSPDQLESDAQIQWLWFVIITLFSHLLVTSVFFIPLVRPVRITLQILGVLLFFCTYEERAAYAQYLQVLYVIFPACYCFWYHFAIVAYEFLFTCRCKNHKHIHVKKMVYSISLILLLVAAVLASVYTEYASLAVSKEHADTLSCHFFRSSGALGCPSADKGSFQKS